MRTEWDMISDGEGSARKQSEAQIIEALKQNRGRSPGAEEPYDKLKRALRAEIDEAAWSALYSTTSRPFDLPKTGKIAIKVINHYGDEVLKVYDMKHP